MIKTKRGEKIAETLISVTAIINLVLIHVLFSLSEQFRVINRYIREIPDGETLQDIRLNLFQTTYITDKAKYLSNNGSIIIFAVILGVCVLVMLVVLGIYFASHDKHDKKENSSWDC